MCPFHQSNSETQPARNLFGKYFWLLATRGLRVVRLPLDGAATGGHVRSRHRVVRVLIEPMLVADENEAAGSQGVDVADLQS
jgi:hypothetical protein